MDQTPPWVDSLRKSNMQMPKILDAAIAHIESYEVDRHRALRTLMAERSVPYKTEDSVDIMYPLHRTILGAWVGKYARTATQHAVH